MCGISGFLDPAPNPRLSEFSMLATRMADTLVSRGPDDNGVWVDQTHGIGLAHRRLSVIDLSPSGRQPMLSADGRFVLVYNGELYNFQELRADLEAHGHVFRGNSDSEVLLEACAAWGIEQTVRRCLGMFAFGLWDRQEHCLTLVRDRIGIKPLYWARFGQVFLFGSELKALRAHPCFETQLDRDMVIPFLRYNYIPAPHSIYRDVYKLEPGCMLQVRSQHEPHITRYWDLNQVAQQGTTAPLQADDGQTLDQLALDQLETLLSDAVQRRMVADVPLGAFLSGGIDSSAIVALMQQHSSRPIKTFTIGFQEADRDESQYAQQIAHHLGTDHQTLVVEPSHAVDLLPRLPTWYDEPFADTSQVPTCFVSHLARQEVTVSLSGDGGDELFGGYKRYIKAAKTWDKVSQIPRPVRTMLAQSIGVLPPLLENVQSLARKPISRLVKHTHQFSRALSLDTADFHDRQLWRRWEDPARLVIDADATAVQQSDDLTRRTAPDSLADIVSQMQFADILSYLPDNNLTKVDRASMGVSLEVRVPILDHRIVEFTWTLPAHMKIRNGQGKWLLRQLLYKYVPHELVERPKQGFGVPLSGWLRGPLREWAEELLSEQALCKTGVFNSALVRQKWTEHIAGTSDWKRPLWNVLMFQAWHNRWM